MVTSSGNALASVISAVPILKPVTLQANTYAASVSILQLWLHVEDDAAPLTIASDVLNIVGAVSGIVAGGAFLLAAPGVLAGATIVAIAANLTNIFISSGAAEKLYDWSVGVIETWAPPDGIPVSTETLFLDTSGVWREFFAIKEDPNADVAGIIIHHNDWASAQAYFIDENPAPPPTPRPKERYFDSTNVCCSRWGRQIYSRCTGRLRVDMDEGSQGLDNAPLKVRFGSIADVHNYFRSPPRSSAERMRNELSDLL